MSFVAVVTVSICFKRDRFIRTVTVWAVPTSKTFEDIQRWDTRNRLPSAASGTQQRQPSCGGRGGARRGRASGR